MLPNVPVHLIQRGNNRELCFFADDDYRFFLEWLEEYGRSESWISGDSILNSERRQSEPYQPEI